MFKFELHTETFKPVRVEVSRYTQKSTGVYIITAKLYYDGEVIYRESQYKVPDGERFNLSGFEFASEMLNRFVYNSWNNTRKRLAAVVALHHLTERNKRKLSKQDYTGRLHYIAGLHNEVVRQLDVTKY